MRRFCAFGGGQPLRASCYGETFEQALTAFRHANPTAYYCHVVEIELTSDRPIGAAQTVKFNRRAKSQSHSRG